jgi:hypothetical protein
MAKKKRKAENGKSRLNLALSPTVYNRLKALEQETGATSMTDVIAKALALYDCIIDQKKAGHRVLIEDDKKNHRELWIL